MAFEVLELVVLDFSFVLQSLVLGLDVALDFRNVLFGFCLGVLFKIFKELGVLLLNSLSLTFKVILALVFNLH